jgi:hypothetical protein
VHILSIRMDGMRLLIVRSSFSTLPSERIYIYIYSQNKGRCRTSVCYCLVFYVYRQLTCVLIKARPNVNMLIDFAF